MLIMFGRFVRPSTICARLLKITSRKKGLDFQYDSAEGCDEVMAPVCGV